MTTTASSQGSSKSRTRSSAGSRRPPTELTLHVNEVRLVGRLAAEPVARELPSGDALVSFRLVVERGSPAPGAVARRAPTVDTLDCTAWRAKVRRASVRLHPGDLVEVTGALRRRFWRTPAGPASRSEVEVLTVRRVAGEA